MSITPIGSIPSFRIQSIIHYNMAAEDSKCFKKKNILFVDYQVQSKTGQKNVSKQLDLMSMPMKWLLKRIAKRKSISRIPSLETIEEEEEEENENDGHDNNTSNSS